MLPCRTRLAKQSPLPFIMAVPQSGPIIKSPFACAICLSLTSSSRVTLSLNIMTLSPCSRAKRASRAAYSPGVEIMTKLAARSWQAPAMVAGAILRPSAFCTLPSLSWRNTSSTRVSASSLLLTPITQSLLVASLSSSAVKPKPSISCRFMGVPMRTTTSSAPPARRNFAVRDISVTESKYSLQRTLTSEFT